MERLIIDIPEGKSSLVKQILKELGVIIELEKEENILEVRKKLANISIWSAEDLKAYEKLAIFKYESSEESSHTIW